MFLRLRWFVLGFASAVGTGFYVAARMRRLRERFSPANLRKTSLRSLADAVDGAAEVVAPGGLNGDHS